MQQLICNNQWEMDRILEGFWPDWNPISPQGTWSVSSKFMPTAGKPYVRFASFLSIALCLGVGVAWGGGGMLTFLVLRT